MLWLNSQNLSFRKTRLAQLVDMSVVQKQAGTENGWMNGWGDEVMDRIRKIFKVFNG